jgi:hypothetical protein
MEGTLPLKKSFTSKEEERQGSKGGYRGPDESSMFGVGN